MLPLKHDYQRLFKALNESQSFDEKAFLATEAGKEFVGKMPRKKHELYEKILQNVRAFRQPLGRQKAMEIQLREQLEDVLFLRDKKLFEQSNRRLSRVKGKAISYHLHELLIVILRIERSLLLRIQPVGYVKKLWEIHKEIEEASMVIKNKGQMLYFYDQYFIQVIQHKKLNAAIDANFLKTLIASPELKDPNGCLSFEAESNFYFCHAIHHYLLGNAQATWEFSKTLYLRWEEEREIKKVKAIEYRNVINNFLIFSNYASRYEGFDCALSRMLEGPFYSDEEEASAIDNAIHVNIQRHLHCCNWDAAKATLQEYRRKLDFISEHLIPSRIMVHYLSFSRLSLVLEDWTGAYSWAKKVDTAREGKEHLALIWQARMQEMMALYEAPELGDLINRHRAAMRQFRKARESNEIEAKIIHAIWAASKCVLKTESASIFRKLYLDVKGKQAGKNNIEEFGIIWLKAKSKGISLKEALESQRELALSKK